MSIKGVIFDFNGTLFWDTPFHNRAWDLFLHNHHIKLTDQEKNEKIHGKNNRDILQGLFEREIEADELLRFIEEKEQTYRTICLEENGQLAEGSMALFQYLKQAQIPYTIATASEKENVLFFFQQFGLDEWFNFDKVVYDDGILRGKPSPDYFKKAIDILQLKPEDCLVFEDSYAGIKAAENAGVGKIIIVNSTQGDYSQYQHQTINHFNEINRQLFS